MESVPCSALWQVARREVATLHGQLATLRQSKHQTEQERAEGSRVQEETISRLQERLGELEVRNRQVEELEREKEVAAREARAELDKSRGELFQARAKLETFYTREATWKEGRREGEALRKQLVLQGELVERYRERLDQLPTAAREQEVLIIQEAAKHEVAAAKTDLVWKQQEVAASAARVLELEARVGSLERAVGSQEELVVQVQQEMGERMEVVEERYRAIRSVNIHLEGSLMELHERLERAGRGRSAGPGAGLSSEAMEVSQGSRGPGSLVGSQSSDTGEYIRSDI